MGLEDDIARQRAQLRGAARDDDQRAAYSTRQAARAPAWRQEFLNGLVGTLQRHGVAPKPAEQVRRHGSPPGQWASVDYMEHIPAGWRLPNPPGRLFVLTDDAQLLASSIVRARALIGPKWRGEYQAAGMDRLFNAHRPHHENPPHQDGWYNCSSSRGETACTDVSARITRAAVDLCAKA